MKLQIACEYFKTVIVNGRPVSGCLRWREFITSANVEQYCLGDKCKFPILK